MGSRVKILLSFFLRDLLECSLSLIYSYMSDYAPESDQSEQPEYAKEVLYSQAVVRGVVCGSRDMFEDLIRCVEINKIVPVVDKVEYCLRAENRG